MFTVLRSSAGAGKTHTLVKHYLTLCLRGDVGAYRQVLALTFTNKAAGELKERVVGYLEKLAAKDPSTPLEAGPIRDVMDHLVRESKVDEDKVAQRADEVLRHMLHHWGEVAISTIDAFTRRVVQPFARDLQLDHDLRMTTEEEWYRDRAVDDLIAEAGVDPLVTSLLTEACRQLIEEERKWDPGEPLRQLSKELTKEHAIAPLRALHALDADQLRPLMDQLRKEIGTYQQAMRLVGSKALELIEGAGLMIEDLYYGRTGFYGWFIKLNDFGDAWIAPGVQALKSFEGGKWNGSKALGNAKATLESLAPELMRLYQQGETLREGQRDHFIRKAVLRELAPAFALRELERCLANLKSTDGVAFFSDLTRRVAEVVRDEPVPYIYERLGERYRHFLIDEFQDTSLLQWNTLLPLIDNALGQGGSALVVGDAKQAIYRWRNGEVRLFRDLPKVFGKEDNAVDDEREATLERFHQAGAPLNDNRRSAHTIVEFNNALFGTLAEVLAADLRNVYDKHAQQPRKEAAGLVHLEKLEKDKSGDDARDAVRDFALRCVHETIADGFAAGDIGVLVRSKSVGRMVAAHLIDAGFAVISPDGLRLSGDPVAELLVDLLRFMHTADVTAAARVVQYRALVHARHATHVDPFANSPTIPDPAASVRTWLHEHGDLGPRTTLEALVSKLARMIGVHATADAQLLTLLNEVHIFSNEHGNDIGAFLEHYARSGGERTSAAPANAAAIHVMTVHKAKGLEFPVVIVSNARMESGGRHVERAWIAPGTAVPVLSQALVRDSKMLRDAGVQELLKEVDLRTLDHLDQLYVAFTRPKQRLYALVPEARPDTVTAALLAYMDVRGVEGRVVEGERTGPWEEAEHTASDPLIDVSTSGSTPSLTLRFEAPESWDPADPDPYRRYGNAVHEVLGQVQHAGMLHDAIAAAVDQGLLDPGEAAPLAVQLHPLLASESLRHFYGTQLTVRTEATLITANGKAHRPDRVVFDGEVVRVLDIKTGAPDERHRDQVLDYMHLLRELGGAHVEGALLYIRTGTLLPVSA